MRVLGMCAVLLLLSGCEKDALELSTTAPSGTLPMPTHTGDPATVVTPRSPATETAPTQTTTSADDSGFDFDATATVKDVPPTQTPP